MTDPHAELVEQIWRSVVQGPAKSPQQLRAAVAEQRGVPEELRSLVAMVHEAAYRVSDHDVARVQSVYGDDQLFELIVSAALGASRKRLRAGLAALNLA